MKARGFTIVELLIVVVVIAILAAITVVAYTGIQNRAHDAAVQSDLRKLGNLLEDHKTTTGTGIYVANAQIGNVMNNYKVKLATGSYANVNNLLSCRSGDGKEAAIMIQSKSGNTYYFNANKGGLGTYSGAWGTGSVACAGGLIDTSGQSSLWGYTPSNGWTYGL